MRLIDADALKEKWLFRGEDGKPYRDEIDNAPTIEPKQEWIPVSERLPEKEGVYLVSCYGETYFDTLCGFFEGDDGDSLCEWDISVNVPYEDLAWMDLPAPWKGASDGRSKI